MTKTLEIFWGERLFGAYDVARDTYMDRIERIWVRGRGFGENFFEDNNLEKKINIMRAINGLKNRELSREVVEER